MSTNSPGRMLKMKCVISILLLICNARSVFSRPFNSVVLLSPSSWIPTPVQQSGFFFPQGLSSHTHGTPMVPVVRYAHLGSQNYFSPIFYYETARMGSNFDFPYPVPQYISVPSTPNVPLQKFINQPLSATLLRAQQQLEKQQRTDAVASTQPVTELNVIKDISVPIPIAAPQHIEQIIPAVEEVQQLAVSPTTEPPKEISTLPPPTPEEEKHLTKFEEEYELLKETKKSPQQQNQLTSNFQQFTVSQKTIQSNINNVSIPLREASNEQFDESNLNNLKFDIRLPTVLTNRKQKPRRSVTSSQANINDKKMFAAISAVLKHKRRRHRQLEENNLEIPFSDKNEHEQDFPPLLISEEDKLESESEVNKSENAHDEDLPPLLISKLESDKLISEIKQNKNEHDKDLPPLLIDKSIAEQKQNESINDSLTKSSLNNDSREIMNFSAEGKLDPTNRHLLTGIAMTNVYNPMNPGAYVPRVEEEELIRNFEYELFNDTFSGDDVGNDLPPTLFMQETGEKDQTNIVNHEESNGSDLIDDSIKIEPSDQIFDGSKNESSKPTESSTEQTSEPVPLPDMITSDLPPIPSSLFQDGNDNSNYNNPIDEQVDDLISSDLPPLPNISLFPVNNQNGIELPRIPLPRIPESQSPIFEPQAQLPEPELQPAEPEPQLPEPQSQLPEPQPQLPEAPIQVSAPSRQTSEIPIRPIFPSGNLLPIFPQPEEEPIPVTSTPNRTTNLPKTFKTTERDEILLPREIELPKTNELVFPVKINIKPEKTKTVEVYSESEEDDDPNPPLPQQSNDWIRDIALKALDRGISVQHIYSINVGKINVKSEGQPQIEYAQHHPDFLTSFVKTFEQVVDAVRKSVMNGISPSTRVIQQATLEEKALQQSPIPSQLQNPIVASTTKEEVIISTTPHLPKRSDLKPLPIDPRIRESDEDESIKELNEFPTAPNNRVPLNIDLRILR